MMSLCTWKRQTSGVTAWLMLTGHCRSVLTQLDLHLVNNRWQRQPCLFSESPTLKRTGVEGLPRLWDFNWSGDELTVQDATADIKIKTKETKKKKRRRIRNTEVRKTVCCFLKSSTIHSSSFNKVYSLTAREVWTHRGRPSLRGQR